MEIPIEKEPHPNVCNHLSTEGTKVGRFIQEGRATDPPKSMVPGYLIWFLGKNKLSDRLHKNSPATWCTVAALSSHISNILSVCLQGQLRIVPHQLNDLRMARLSSVTGPVGPDPTSINLSRMLSRLQHILINSDGTETKLRSSSYEREKVGIVRSLRHSSLEGANYAIHSEHRVCADPPPTARARCSPNKDPKQEARSTNRFSTEEGRIGSVIRTIE